MAVPNDGRRDCTKRFIAVALLTVAFAANAGTPADERAIRAEFAALSDRINSTLTAVSFAAVRTDFGALAAKAERLAVAIPPRFAVDIEILDADFSGRDVTVYLGGPNAAAKTAQDIEIARAAFLAFSRSPVPKLARVA